MSTYQWAPPKAKRGDRVSVRDHRGALREGVVAMVDTHYDRDLTSYHIFAVQIDGWKTWRHLGSEQVLCVLPEANHAQ